MHGEDFQPAVQGVTCPGSVNNSNCAYNFLCVALKIHPTDFSSMSSNSAAIYYILREETRTLKLQDGSGCLCSPPILTLFPVSMNRREALRSRSSDEGGVHLQRMQGLPCGDGSLYLVWALQDSCWSMVGSADRPLADRPLWTLVSPLGTLERPGGGSPHMGGPWRKGTAAAWCRARTHRGQNRGQLAAPAW